MTEVSPTPVVRRARIAPVFLIVLAAASLGLALFAGGMATATERFLYGGLAALALLLMAGPMLMMAGQPAWRRLAWSLVWGGTAGLVVQLFFAGARWPDTPIAAGVGAVLAAILFAVFAARR